MNLISGYSSSDHSSHSDSHNADQFNELKLGKRSHPNLPPSSSPSSDEDNFIAIAKRNQRQKRLQLPKQL